MDMSIREQEREIADVIQRAKGSPDKTGQFRRDTLKRLIDLVHSPHPTLKILAAVNIRFFFNDFPELEETAINAVYDLCEDHSSQVRIEGYAVITQVSKAENKWVKRNADVLLQLLQSDEPDEVVVVKKALIDHLDMDSKVTLGVLCDQIIPPDEHMDEEEQNIRDRLRLLVLSFLTREAKQAIIQRYAVPGSRAEEVLVNSLLAAISKLGFHDVEMIVKDLLVSLTVYKHHSLQGQALLQVLLDKSASSLRTGLRLGDLASLQTTRLYLDLAAFLVIDNQVAPPIQLLRFYCSHIFSKITLQKFPQDERTLVVCNLADVLVASNEDSEFRDDGPPMDVLRRQIVDACPFFLETLGKSGLLNQRSTNACVVLLRSCLRRRDESSWTVPPNLSVAVGKLPADYRSQDLQNLIRSLVRPTGNASSQQSNATLRNTPHRLSNDKSFPSALPDRPPTSPPPRRMIIAPKSQAYRDQTTTGPLPSSSASTSTINNPKISLEDPPRLSKRRKDDMNRDDDSGPSLLSRIGTSFSNGLVPRTTVPIHPSNTAQASTEYHPSPVGGYSIKGAAKIAVSVSSAPDRPTEPPVSSLLDRLEGPGGSSTLLENDWVTGGRKKKKRGWLQD